MNIQLLEAAREFLTDKLEINDGMKVGMEWYPRVDVQLAWLQEFAASVTQSQAAEIERLTKALIKIRDEYNIRGYPVSGAAYCICKQIVREVLDHSA